MSDDLNAALATTAAAAAAVTPIHLLNVKPWTQIPEPKTLNLKLKIQNPKL
jgi:subtilase family serine protease